MSPCTGGRGQYATLNRAVGALAFGNGYLVVGSDGGMFSYSDKPFLGSLGGTVGEPIVAVATWRA